MRAFSYAVVLSASIMACATEAEPTPAPSSDVGSTTPPPAKDPAPSTKPPATDDPPPAPAKNECKLDAMTGVGDVVPGFVVYSFPNEIPLEMTGGTLSGQYAVDGAKVYLPSGTAGLVDPEQSTGSINAWAIFDGTNYRLHLKADFTIASVQGPMSQGVDTESQGGFKANAEKIVLDHECTADVTDEAEYSFTDDGSGHATILIKTETPYGDTYLQLDATKM